MQMTFEVEIVGRVYVSVEFGGADSARDLVRDRVANDWLLQVAEGSAMGKGKYLVRGLSAAVGEVKPFRENRRVIADGTTQGIEEELF